MKNDHFWRAVQYSGGHFSKLRVPLVQPIQDLVLGHILSVSPLWAVHRVTDDP